MPRSLLKKHGRRTKMNKQAFEEAEKKKEEEEIGKLLFQKPIISPVNAVHYSCYFQESKDAVDSDSTHSPGCENRDDADNAEEDSILKPNQTEVKRPRKMYMHDEL
ncbi:hypothetical protein SLEP1_g28821 [Rubroshorea leprosula]|uniref:Uncharacterized protein n=1 Tax=Rubroshorea leprosula TaxID=152421 RepID=A0AAV5K613_9ROSI|nr:hypothetical protein SLEP1_g28821 [Rubroshorea leprosula]